MSTGSGAPVLSVRLTSHPMQRAGAFALALLAAPRHKVRAMAHPEQLNAHELRAANAAMTRDLEATVGLADSKQPGGFWLGASYLLWPNCPLNTTNRKSLSVVQRRERLHAWRDIPDPDTVVAAPCTLCGHTACGWFGKTDIPLAESASYRNTTVRGHDGLALCRGCVLSFYALPYACVISGGRAALVHSWDEVFLARTCGFQAKEMARRFIVSSGATAVPAAKPAPYARQRRAVQALLGYERALTDGVELMVFSNSNKEQELRIHPMEEPLAEWVRTRAQGANRAGWRYLARAHHSAKVPGAAMLARNLLENPRWVVSSAATYLQRLAEAQDGVAGEAPVLADTCFSYAAKVLMSSESDTEEIRRLARRIAETVNTADHTDLKKYLQAHKAPTTLRTWLRRKAMDHLLHSTDGAVFVSDRQWLLLFDAQDRTWLHRDLLLIGVLAELHALAPPWRKDPEARRELDEASGVNDATDTDDED